MGDLLTAIGIRSPSVEAMDVEEVRDFSHLPYVAWVNIMRYLNNNDRRSASQTCSAVDEAFRAASLWRKLSIVLIPGDSSSRPDQGLIRFYEGFLRNFSGFVQDLELIIHKQYVTSHDENVFKLLQSLQGIVNDHQLHRLHLNLGGQLGVIKRSPSMGGLVADNFTQKVEFLSIMTESCLKSGALQIFSVENWPRNLANPNFQKIHTPLLDGAFPSMKELSLYWCDAKNTSWLGTNDIPTPGEFLAILRNLPNVVILRVQSGMLNGSVLRYLASDHPAKLKLLAVLLTKPEGGNVNPNNADTVDSTHVMKLVNKHRALEMHITLSTRLTPSATSLWFAEGLPVTEIHYMRFSEFRKDHTVAIMRNFWMTLKKLCVYSSSQYRLDQHLVELVNDSIQLRHFVFFGHVKYHTVRELAMVHGRHWQLFDVSARNVITERNFDGNEDEVIQQRGDGSITMVEFERGIHGGERKTLLMIMKDTVSRILDRKWTPAEYSSQCPPINV